MLHWFARRLKEVHEKDERGEKGFTLIELLVVVIIIGILAAIAIPTFLNQRQNAQRAALEADVRNLATEAETYYAANNTYVGFPASANYTGFNSSDGVTVSALPANMTANAFCVSGTHANLGAEVWSYDNDRATQLDNVAC